MHKVSSNLCSSYGQDMDFMPKRQGPEMPRVTTNNRRMTNISLGNGENIQGIRRNPFCTDAHADLPDLHPPPSVKPLRYTPGLHVDCHLEVLRPVRNISHPALQGGEDPEVVAMKKEFEVRAPFQFQPSSLSSNPLDMTQIYPQDDLSRIKMRNRNFQSSLLPPVPQMASMLMNQNNQQQQLHQEQQQQLIELQQKQLQLYQNQMAHYMPQYQSQNQRQQMRVEEPTPSRTFLATPTHSEMTSVDQLPKPRRTIRTDREAADKEALRNTFKLRNYEPFSVPEAIAIRTVLLTRPAKVEQPTPHAAVEEVVAECTAVSEAVSPPNSVEYSSEQMSPTDE